VLPKTLGILGGMGPAATAEFLRLLASDAPAATDQEHPRIVMLSEPGIPDRSTAILNHDNEPAKWIRDGLATLAAWGADLLAIPCNTAHVFLDEVNVTVPVVDIADATLDRAVSLSPDGAWLTATTGTLASGLYQKRAAALGYRLLVPEESTQHRVETAARLVKAGRHDEAGAEFAAAVHALWRREDLPVVAACTELPLAYAAAPLRPDKMISSLAALSAACVDNLYR